MTDPELFRLALEGSQPSGTARYAAKRLYRGAVLVSDFTPLEREEKLTALIAALLTRHPDLVKAAVE